LQRIAEPEGCQYVQPSQNSEGTVVANFVVDERTVEAGRSNGAKATLNPKVRCRQLVRKHLPQLIGHDILKPLLRLLVALN